MVKKSPPDLITSGASGINARLLAGIPTETDFSPVPV